MGKKRLFRILTAAALCALSLSLMQCLIIPLRHSSDGDESVKVTGSSTLAPNKPDSTRPTVTPSRPGYGIGSVISVSGIMRQDFSGFYLDDSRSNLIFRFVNVKASEADDMNRALNKQVTVRIKIVSQFGNTYNADLLNFGG
jgi:hypothetical protein